MSVPDRAKISSPSGKTISIPTGIFIDNVFAPSASCATFESINPATGKPLCSISLGSPADVDRAVASARKAFEESWGKKSTPAQRGAALYKWAELVEAHAEELSELESLDNGKPVWMARDFDVADSAGCLRYYAGLADKIEGKTIEQTEGEKMAWTRLEPIGVCGQIIPWNYPIQMFAWKVGPALAAGNCVVMKPAEQTPLSALRLAELSVEAGFPPGVLSVVNGYGKDVGDAVARHMDIDKSPVVVFESADLEQAVSWVTLGILYNQGQDCTAGSRLFVQESIYNRFMPLLIKAFKAHRIGDPFDANTFQGAQVSKAQQERILGYIESGKRDGAKVEVGGGAWTDGPAELAGGYFVQPTIFSGCKKGMKIVDEETFGPVLAVAKFSSEAEATQLANDTSYGLGAGVFSSDANQCMRMASALEAGTVWVNNYVALSNAVPFGGFKASGMGRELGVDAIKEYTQIKSMHFNYGEKLDWPLPKI